MICLIECCDNAVIRARYCSYHAQTWNKFRKNGFTESKYQELMQATQCEICGKAGQMGAHHNRPNLFADHDHAHCPEGQICPTCFRGLICNRCNTFLAGLDDKLWLKNAQKYLAAHDLMKTY